VSEVEYWVLTVAAIAGWGLLVWRVADPIGEVLKAWAADIEGRRSDERAWSDGYAQGVEEGFAEGMEDARVIHEIQSGPKVDLEPHREVIEELLVAAMRYGWEIGKIGTTSQPDPIFNWVDGVPTLVIDSSHLTLEDE
jgi:hypothetical protein